MMKKIKDFKSFNESLTQDEIDNLLDKINDEGIDSLSDEQRKELDQAWDDEDEVSERDTLIVNIIEFVQRSERGGVDLKEENASQFYRKEGKESHVITTLYHDGVLVEVYEDDKMIGDYEMDYVEIEDDILYSLNNNIKKIEI